MVDLISERVLRALKVHQCYSCYCEIPVGTRYHMSFLKDSGQAYSLRDHQDCRAMSLEMVAKGAPDDYCDGIPPLWDMMRDSGDFAELCDAYRGFYPHVVARMELTQDLIEIRRERDLAEWRARQAAE